MAGLEQRSRPMPNAFNFAASPFDCLTPDEQALVRDGVDIAYFPEGAVVLDAGSAPTHLFVIIKGHVVQTEGDEVLASYGPDDSFDGRALVAGRTGSRFTVAEELIAYQLARETVGELIARNTAFGALLFSDLGHKLGTLAQRADRHELQSLTLARVDQAYLRAAHVVDAATDIVSVVRLFHAERTTCVLVSGLPQGGLGIFTGTTLQRAILDGRPLERLAVGEFASQPVFTVRATTSWAMPWSCCCAPACTGWPCWMHRARCWASWRRWTCSASWPTTPTSSPCRSSRPPTCRRWSRPPPRSRAWWPPCTGAARGWP